LQTIPEEEKSKYSEIDNESNFIK